MTYRLETQADLEKAMHELVLRDPRLKAPLEATGMPELRRREPGFAGLAMIVVGQQLSTASASAIWGRLTEALSPFTPDAIRLARPDKLGRLGLSAAKIKTLKAVAKEILAKRLDLDALVELDADPAHEILTNLHGIGPWTADVYLLFCLGHSDAWPGGDLAVMEGARVALGLEKRPTVKEMGPLGEIWRPYRGVAAHLWWAYYKVARKRDGAVAAVAAATTPVLPKKPKSTGGATAKPKSVSIKSSAARARNRRPVTGVA